MATVLQEIENTSSYISDNITELKDNQGLLARNILKACRDLVNHTSLLIHTNDLHADSRYVDLKAAIKHVKSTANLYFLREFYDRLEISISHYTPDVEGAERLILKYYEPLFLIRNYLEAHYGIQVLQNLEDIPLEDDPAYVRYHEEIAKALEREKKEGAQGSATDNYYINRVTPFFVGRQIFYEVVYSRALGSESKFNRNIAYCDNRVLDNYATNLELIDSEIKVAGMVINIKIIKSWRVNIRPCELQNIGRIVGFEGQVNRRQQDYELLMDFLTSYRVSLIDVMNFEEAQFRDFIRKIKSTKRKSVTARIIWDLYFYCLHRKDAHNVIRYLILNLRNSIIRRQFPDFISKSLSGVYLDKDVWTFEKTPFSASLKDHNPRLLDVIRSVKMNGHEHELVARRLLTAVENEGRLYVNRSEFDLYDEQDSSLQNKIDKYNNKLIARHKGRSILGYNDVLFIKEYEDTTVEILKKSQSYTYAKEDKAYSTTVEKWLNTPTGIDDENKKGILKGLFSHASAAVIYGAAGTGKTKMIEHISAYFSKSDKLYLANTNAAVENLRTRLSGSGEFRTIDSCRSSLGISCDVLFMDECSTVSNASILWVLTNVSFKYLVLVGDIYQIESIRFGNWFNAISGVLPRSSVFELNVPYRTSDDNLKLLWQSVRLLDGKADEYMARQKYCHEIDETIFDRANDNEIILSLNYDGLYGVNNLNRLLQSKNNNQAITWNGDIYKIGDPIIFNDMKMYKPLIHNNMKGVIEDITINSLEVTFTIKLDPLISVTKMLANRSNLVYISDNSIRFTVEKSSGNDQDDSDGNYRTIVPFQVAYAITVHRAQGLEYDSVKVIITNDIEERISHNIFYTAITRARKNLMIYWSKSSQRRVMDGFKLMTKNDDISYIKKRYQGLLR